MCSVISLQCLYVGVSSISVSSLSMSVSHFSLSSHLSLAVLSQSQSHIASGGQSVSKSWCRAPSGAHDQIFITVRQLRSCFFLWGALSNERTNLSFLYAAGTCQRSLLGPESLGTRDHILLSHSQGSVAVLKSQSHIATDGQSVSKSWCRAPFGAYDQIFSTV
jgi:hypothetical protein